MAEASPGEGIITIWLAFGAAAASLLLGGGLYIWNIRRPQGSLEQTNVIAWLLIAMTPALILYSVFPESNFDLDIRAASATGAIGLFVWIWIYGVRSARKAAERDLDGVRAHLNEAEQKLHRYEKRAGIKSFDRYRCFLKSYPDRCIGVATGALENIKGIDLWTNSENTHMKMSRINERSISASIRYLGAKVDDNGDIVDDTIAKELQKYMEDRNRTIVDPHTVIITGPGRLSDKGVKRILHVASVQGQRGSGFTPVANIDRCVTEALKKANEPEIADIGASSILLPLFGTGQAGGTVEPTVKQLVEPAVHCLRQSGSTIHEVYFLTYSELDFEACCAVLEQIEELQPLKRVP